MRTKPKQKYFNKERTDKMKKTLSLLLALLMLLSLCACGSSAKFNSGATASEPQAAAMDMAPAPDISMRNESYDMAVAEETGFAAAGSTLMADGGSETPAEENGADINPDKIIYSGDATVETTDFDATVAAVAELVKSYKGWIESSSVNGANYYSRSRGYSADRSASYTLRIPSERFSELMTNLSTLGNVPYTYIYTENVTAQYYDTQARLTAYQTQEARLLEMMEKAESVEDVIAIEEKLTELRYQIESLQSSLNNWDRRVNYSTLCLNIQEVQEYTPEKESKISYGRELWLALTGALKSTGNFFKNLLVFLVSALPAIVILAVLFFILRPVVKKAAMKKRAKKEKTEEEKKEE